MSNPIKSALLSMALSFTNGKLDTALARRIAYGKAGAVPAEVHKATLAKIDEILAKVDPAQHSRIKVTFYVPKVELE